MGVDEFGQGSTDLFRSGAWKVKSWEQDHSYATQPPSAELPSGANTIGLASYRPVSDKDFDRTSGYSSDDACSSADSVFDSSSVVSSQSCYSSVASEASDDAFEGRDTHQGYKHHNHFDDHVELLQGLGGKQSTNGITNDEQSVRSNIPRSHPSSAQTGKVHPRRSGSIDSNNGPPCSLKRDTDSADCFVMLLITFAARLITAIWPLSACPPMMSSCFNGAGVLPLEVFIHETLRRSKTSYSTLQVALFYIILLKDKLADRDFTKEQANLDQPNQQQPGAQTCRAMQCGRRMFLAALMLASKYLQDRNYSTRAWSKISGLRIPEINENETEYLKSIDYKLHMKRDAFENWSKIVITLSKLSKVQGAGSSIPGSFRRSGPGADHLLAALSAGATSSPTSGVQSNQTNTWWIELVKKLNPQVVDDSDCTDTFLQENIPQDLSELLANHKNALPTPPTSPDASPPHIPDMIFNDVFTSRKSTTNSVSTPTEPRVASPIRTSTLPMRPQLRNLPTPQSTPRGAEASPWISISHRQQKSLRCSASADVLRAMRKQCILNANLERCPPPRPHSLALPPVRNQTRPAESSQTCYSEIDAPAVFSPGSSILAQSTPRTTRSRSSSISSTSSWLSWASAPPRSLPSQAVSETSSPLGRMASVAEERLQSSHTSDAHPLRRKSKFSSGWLQDANTRMVHGVTGFHDEGYGSEDDRNARRLASSVEADAIEVLMNMRNVSTEHQLRMNCLSTQSREPSRGHKRTISKTTDPLQDRVSELLRSQSIEDQVMDDSASTPTDAYLEKRWQKPSKTWAMSKKPLPNAMDNKRLALHCAYQQTTASELASKYLKDQFISA